MNKIGRLRENQRKEDGKGTGCEEKALLLLSIATFGDSTTHTLATRNDGWSERGRYYVCIFLLRSTAFNNPAPLALLLLLFWSFCCHSYCCCHSSPVQKGLDMAGIAVIRYGTVRYNTVPARTVGLAVTVRMISKEPSYICNHG